MSRPTEAQRAAVMLKERIGRLRGPGRLNMSDLHREIYGCHQDALHLCELLAGAGNEEITEAWEQISPFGLTTRGWRF